MWSKHLLWPLDAPQNRSSKLASGTEGTPGYCRLPDLTASCLTLNAQRTQHDAADLLQWLCAIQNGVHAAYFHLQLQDESVASPSCMTRLSQIHLKTPRWSSRPVALLPPHPAAPLPAWSTDEWIHYHTTYHWMYLHVCIYIHTILIIMLHQ